MRVESDLESSTKEYAARFAGAVGAAMLARQSELIQRAVRELTERGTSAGSRPFSVLDVGGGHAQALRALSDLPGLELHLLASSEAAIGCAAPLVESGRVRVHLGSLERSGLTGGAFDVVTCFRQLPHVRDWRALAQELARLAAQRIIIDYPPWASVNVLSGALFPLKKRLEGNTRPFRLFTHGEVLSEFANAGFERAWREGQFLFPLALYRMLGSAPVMTVLEWPGALTGIRRTFGNPCVSVFDRRASLLLT